jgi:hypothetical protein
MVDVPRRAAAVGLHCLALGGPFLPLVFDFRRQPSSSAAGRRPSFPTAPVCRPAIPVVFVPILATARHLAPVRLLPVVVFWSLAAVDLGLGLLASSITRLP